MPQNALFDSTFGNRKSQRTFKSQHDHVDLVEVFTHSPDFPFSIEESSIDSTMRTKPTKTTTLNKETIRNRPFKAPTVTVECFPSPQHKYDNSGFAESSPEFASISFSDIEPIRKVTNLKKSKQNKPCDPTQIDAIAASPIGMHQRTAPGPSKEAIMSRMKEKLAKHHIKPGSETKIFLTKEELNEEIRILELILKPLQSPVST